MGRTGPLNQPEEVTMKWVTRERPVIDRIACPWLIARFIDKDAEFLFVPPAEVTKTAAETGATAYDVPGVELTHVGEGCSFDSFVRKYGLEKDPAIVTIAAIVRGADTDRHDLTPQSSGRHCHGNTGLRPNRCRVAHATDLLLASPVPSRGHPTGGMALSSVHIELP
jgi:hypothetical protein